MKPLDHRALLNMRRDYENYKPGAGESLQAWADVRDLLRTVRARDKQILELVQERDELCWSLRWYGLEHETKKEE